MKHRFVLSWLRFLGGVGIGSLTVAGASVAWRNLQPRPPFAILSEWAPADGEPSFYELCSEPRPTQWNFPEVTPPARGRTAVTHYKSNGGYRSIWKAYAHRVGIDPGDSRAATAPDGGPPIHFGDIQHGVVSYWTPPVRRAYFWTSTEGHLLVIDVSNAPQAENTWVDAILY